MNRFSTILTAAAVSFGVATVAAPAAKTPPTHGIGTAVVSAKPLPAASGPSLADIVKAQGRRIDRLQVQLSEARSIALEADAAAGDAQSLTACITGGAGLIERYDGTIVGSDQDTLPDDADSFVVATLDDSCIEAS